MSWWECMNETFKTYAPTLDAVEKLIGIAISLALFFLACSANRIAKQERESRKYRIDKDEREIFRSCYTKVAQAISLAVERFGVDNEVKALLWQARDQARLELPEEISNYVQELFSTAHDAVVIYSSYLQSSENGGLPKGDGREEKTKEYFALHTKLTKAKPNEIFAKYMKMEAA